MKRYVFAVLPLLGMAALAVPANAAAPTAASDRGQLTSSASQFPMQVAEGPERGGGGGGPKGGGGGPKAGGGGGPKAGANVGSPGRSMTRGNTPSRTVTRGNDGDRRSGNRVNRGNDGDRRSGNRGNDGDRRVTRDRGGDRDRGGHRGRRYDWGGLAFYFYDGYYHGDCGWLRRRYEATGERYWLVRYRQCRDY